MYTCINRIEQYNDHTRIMLGIQFRSSFNIFKVLTGFKTLVFFTNSILAEFQVGFLPLFCHFLITNNLDWFWIGCRHKNIMLILVFLKTPFLIPHFSYYKIMTFLDMLSVILLSVPIKLISTLVWPDLWFVEKTKVGSIASITKTSSTKIGAVSFYEVSFFWGCSSSL